MNRFVDLSVEALASLLTRQSRGYAFRIEKGLPEGAQIVDVTYIAPQGLVRLHLDREAEPVAIAALVVEPYYRKIVEATESA